MHGHMNIKFLSTGYTGIVHGT